MLQAQTVTSEIANRCVDAWRYNARRNLRLGAVVVRAQHDFFDEHERILLLRKIGDIRSWFLPAANVETNDTYECVSKRLQEKLAINRRPSSIRIPGKVTSTDDLIIIDHYLLDTYDMFEVNSHLDAEGFEVLWASREQVLEHRPRMWRLLGDAAVNNAHNNSVDQNTLS